MFTTRRTSMPRARRNRQELISAATANLQTQVRGGGEWVQHSGDLCVEVLAVYSLHIKMQLMHNTVTTQSFHIALVLLAEPQ